MMTFENVSQRVVASHQRQLLPFAPVIPVDVPEADRQALENSQRDLHAFFAAFYQCVYDDPAAFGLPATADVWVDEGDGKDKKRDVARQVNKARAKLGHGIEFLWLIGRQGTLAGDALHLGDEDYTAFFAKSPRVKRRMLEGLARVGLTMSELDGGTVVGNVSYPAMMPALRGLVAACARYDERMAKFLFARCDFRVHDADYQPDALDVLSAVLPSSEYGQAQVLHDMLAEMAYLPKLSVGGMHDWRIQYQGKRAVKSTPFFEFEYDERRKHPLWMQVKCAAANRLVPLLASQPEVLQQDFFDHAYKCGGASCGWCKTRKALGPSVIERDGEKKTVCWYMRRRFSAVDGEAVKLIRQYAQLHEALA